MLPAINTPVKFEERSSLYMTSFQKGWAVKLCEEGKGYSVRMAQHNGEISSRFTFDREKAISIYVDICNLIETYFSIL
jgi:hypothetical protein